MILFCATYEIWCILYQIIIKVNNTKGLFEIHLFYWNWKYFAENTVDKSKS